MSRMSTIVVLAPGLAHTRLGHPENHGRMVAVQRVLEESGILQQVTAVPPQPASLEQLKRVHTPSLIKRIRTVSTIGGGLLDYGDTYATSQSFELARLAAGGCCTAVDQIMTGQTRNALPRVLWLPNSPSKNTTTKNLSTFCIAIQAENTHPTKNS